MSDYIKINVNANTVINYALWQNRKRVVQSISITNDSEESLEHVEVKIHTEPQICHDYEKHIDRIGAGVNFVMKEVDLLPDASYLAGLTDQENGVMFVSLEKNGETLASVNVGITALCYDEWQGSGYYPELLASFIQPNHPEIIQLVARSAVFMERWTGNPSLDGYLSQDSNRVLSMMGAVYAALQEQNIVYALPPASFEMVGQRIRLPDAVFQQKMGTCLDLTLLYASCLESMGLHPLIILQKNHAFLGVWLEDKNFPEELQEDATLITKRFASGISEIALVETTCITSGKMVSFDEARSTAEHHFDQEDAMEYCIDVARARLSRVRPLPSRVRNEDGWHIERSDIPEEELTEAPKEAAESVDVSELMVESSADKRAQWERKLLDMSLRNTLINLRLTKTMVPIWASSLDQLEDFLAEGEDFIIHPRPGDWKLEKEMEDFDIFRIPQLYEDAVENDFANHIIRSPYTEAELTNALKGLYRSAKTSLEENGASTLYLAMGFLKWYENDRSTKPRYAPLVLLPVDIILKSAKQGYILRLREEDAQINITILEKIKQDFGIQIYGVDPLPMDDHGIDIRKVFTILRKALMAEKRWDIMEFCGLGIFSFSQFVMWNDIHSRSEDLAKNKIVRSLMDGTLAWDAEAMELGDFVSEEDVLLPIAADASQLFAIKEANEGKSFVLHGPPGTGKSQTITALIANALAQGKTVLFVAEKMAALSVVQKRLQNIGIGDFCMELHSNKARKRTVLDQFQRAIDVQKQNADEMFVVKAAQMSKIRQELDQYAKDLHEKRDFGYNVYELINLYEENKDAQDIKPFSREMVSELTRESLHEREILMERLVAAAKEVGHPHNHPLKRVCQTTYSQYIRQNLDPCMKEYQDSLDQMQNSALRLKEKLSEAGERFDYHTLDDKACQLVYWDKLPKAWATQQDLGSYLIQVQIMAGHYRNAEDIRGQMSEFWKDDFFAVNGEALLQEYKKNEKQWFLPKLFGTSRLMKELNSHSKTNVSKEHAVASIQTLVEYQKERRLADELFVIYGLGLEKTNHADLVDWPLVTEMCSELRNDHALAEMRHFIAKDSALVENAKTYLEERKVFSEKKETFYDLLGIMEEECLSGEDTFFETYYKKEEQMLRDIHEHSNELKEWITWQHVAQQAKDMGISQMVEAYEDGADHDSIIAIYKKNMSKALLMKEIDGHPALGNFSGAVFNEKIAQLKRFDEEMKELTKKEIFYRLASRIPDFTKEASKNSEVGILQRAIRSGGRGLSLRNLFDQIPNLMQRLCPCMLMSPISVAQYLVTGKESFDLVVFDEASQLPTCKAIGALARGKEAVIVGDPKQMPPTSFFMSNYVDEDNLDMEDLESILDDCLALNMPQTYLLWHYRSRHESLIEFSNHQFYENKLYTFPSVSDRESKVNLVLVDGTFDKGKSRQNRVEAEAVVEEIKRRCHDPECAKQSLGVVTFNINQQNLIDDMLMDACKEDTELEAWINKEEEPLFIKNLENVQGDERDVILFSVGYGPDKDGKVGLNFGPLNRDGGWRRLNVAVSRARMEMKVFSSMTHDSINLNRTNALGVKALKAFLKFAQDHTMDLDDANLLSQEQEMAVSTGVMDHLCDFLAENGYATEKMVGDSKYRIDIGVIDPDKPERYLLGILFDGPQYGNSKTTRDRELAQISVLEGLGWNMTRIWSMDWWDNAEKEKDKILTLLVQLKEEEKRREEEKSLEERKDDSSSGEDFVQENDAEEVVEILAAEDEEKITTSEERNLYPDSMENESSEDSIEVYQAIESKAFLLTSDQFLDPSNFSYLKRLLEEILKMEAPITESLLTKRLLQNCGIARAGSRIQGHIKVIYDSMELTQTRNADRIIYWNKEQNPEEYASFRTNGEGACKREVLEIPWEEATNAVCQILKDQISLEEDDLIRETSKIMGFSRITNNVTMVFRHAIQLAADASRIAKDRNDRWILDE
ncbi:MAG: DUF3320 domain-containing protein [Eubacteriales bacterium]|nr:DUF3320 domain-containing protein [Eubacteriales bacterium]